MSHQAAPQASAGALSAPPGASAEGTSLREFLAFKLGAEEYGIDILRVQEIRSVEAPTGIANAPGFIKGAVSLRGPIVPIVGMWPKSNLWPEQLRPLPEFNSAIASDHLLAIGAVGERMLILVGIEKLMTSAEMGLVEQTLQ